MNFDFGKYTDHSQTDFNFDVYSKYKNKYGTSVKDMLIEIIKDILRRVFYREHELYLEDMKWSKNE